MSRNATTGIYTRVDNSFSNPVTGTTIDPADADTFFDDVEASMNSFIGTSATSLSIGTGTKVFTTQTTKTFLTGTFVQAISQANSANYMYGTVTSYDSGTGVLTLDIVTTGGSGTLADWLLIMAGARGGTGIAATITAGTTTTGKAGTSASAANSGTSSAAILDFTIPRGADAGMRYAFESSTSMAAPATGGLRLNNASLASVTAIAVNATNSDAVDVSDFVATWDDSTNTVKGYVEVRKEGSGAVLGLYQLTSVTDNTTWLQLAVTYVSGSGSLSAADQVYLTPYIVGNKGADGSGSPANPTATIGLSAVNGVAATYIRSDGAPALSQAITPTWTGLHTFTANIQMTNNTASIEMGQVGSTNTPYIDFHSSSSTTDYDVRLMASGGTSSNGQGTLTFTGGSFVFGGTISDANGAIYSNIPQNSQSAAYTLVLADAHKHIYHPSADTTARTWTIPANSSVAFPIGTAVTFVNDTSGGVITIAITTDTLVLAGAGTTGSRSLAANGVATAIKVTSTRWIISGTGLT